MSRLNVYHTTIPYTGDTAVLFVSLSDLIVLAVPYLPRWLLIVPSRHDKKVLELYGATASVNFPYTGLVDPATMRVHRLRTAGGQELPGVIPSAGADKMKVRVFA